MQTDELEARDWSKTGSLSSTLLQVAVVAALLAAAVYYAYLRGVDRQQASAAIEKSRELIRLDSPADLRAALASLQPVLGSSTRAADVHAVAARIYAELAVVHEDPEALKAGQEHLAKAKAQQSEVEELASAEALLALPAGRTDEAVKRLEALTQRGVRRLDLEYALGRAHLAAGQPDKALAVLVHAAAIAAREPRIHALVGDLLLEAGKVDEAIAAYRRGLAGNAHHPGARLGLAIAQATRAKDPAAAQKVLASLESEGALSKSQLARAAAARPVPAPAASVAADTP